jgi:hypothetical protein
VADEGFEALAGELGDDLPKALKRLEPDQLTDLAQAIAATRQRQSDAFAAGSERALGMIPRLLRGPIRRIVG